MGSQEISKEVKESLDMLAVKRTPLFNTYYPHIKFGPPDPDKLKYAWEIRQPLLPKW